MNRIEHAVGSLSVASLLIASWSGSSVAANDRSLGHDVFMQSGCFACHGELGYGTAGPGFRGDKLLSADQYVVGQILLGRGIMPAFADQLNDTQIAAVATFIRDSWGNQLGPVSVEEVVQIRATLQSATAAGPRP